MAGLSIKQNLSDIRNRIHAAQERSGRLGEEVTLVGVSKKQSYEKVQEAAQWGVRDFGENYLQEAQDKLAKLMHLNLAWHFVGHLQTNKVKHVVGRFAYIQSLDRTSLAEEISKRAMEKGMPQKCLIEINIAQEDSKTGLKPEDLKSFMKEIKDLRGIQLCGLMIMPPFVEKAEENRKYFCQANELLADMQRWAEEFVINSTLLRELSMGTTQDFEVAIEEGATMVRLGTCLFGERV